MKKEKKKTKKSSQTNCESSSTTKESIATEIGHGQNPDITECTCLTKQQRGTRFLQCFKRADISPVCSVHSSKDSTVSQEAKSNEKEKDTTKQPGLVRRIGRWIVKKVTKAKKEEQFSYKLLESRTASMCEDIEPEPELQIFGRLDLGLYRQEEYTPENTTADNYVDSIDETTAVDVSKETGGNMVSSLKDLCTAMADKTGSRTKAVKDRKPGIAYDEAQSTENETKLDNNDMKPNNKQTTVMRLEEMCKEALECHDNLRHVPDNITTDHTEEKNNKDTNGPDKTECRTEPVKDRKPDIANDEVQSTENETKLDNNDMKPKCKQTKVMLLKEISKAALGYPDNLRPTPDNVTTGHTEEKNNQDTNDPDKTECRTEPVKDRKLDIANDEVQTIENETKLDNNDMKPNNKQTTVMRLEEMCKVALECHDNLRHVPDNITTDHAEEKNSQDTNGPDKTEYRTEPVKDRKPDIANDEVQSTENETKLDNNDMKPKCKQIKVMLLKEIAKAALEHPDNLRPTPDNVTTGHTEEKNNQDTNNTGSRTKAAKDRKPDFANDEAQSTEKETKLDNNDTKPENKQTTVMRLEEMCKVALEYPDNLKHTPDNITTDHTEEKNNQDTNDPELDNTSLNSASEDTVLMTLIQLCEKVVSNTNGKKVTEVDEIDRVNDEYLDIESDTKMITSLKSLCAAALKTSGSRTIGMTETKNNEERPTGINSSKQDTTNDKTHPELNKTEMDTDDKKPECDRITVMPLKEICKVTVAFPHETKQSTDDTRTDHTDQDSHDKNDPKQDNIIMNSETDDGIPTTLAQLGTKANIDTDGKKTIGKHNKNNAKNVDKNDPELDNIVMNSKIDDGIPTTLAQLGTKANIDTGGKKTIGKHDKNNAKNVDKIDPELDSIIMNSKIGDGIPTTLAQLGTKANIDTDGKKTIGKHDKNNEKNVETYTDDIIYPECDVQEVKLLKTRCTAEVRLAEAKQMDVKDAKITEINISNICDSKQDISKKENQDKMKQIKPDNGDKKTGAHDIDNANELTHKTNVNLENKTKQLMSLKEICSTAVKTATTMDVVDSVKSSENGRNAEDATTGSNTRIVSLTEMSKAAIRNGCGLKKNVSDTTAEQVHTELHCKSNDSKGNSAENKLNFDKYNAKTLKERFVVAIGNDGNMSPTIHDTQKDQNYEEEDAMSKGLEPNNCRFNRKVINASTKSLKEICLEFLRNFHDAKNNWNKAAEDQISDYIFDKDSSYANKFKTEINQKYDREEAKSLKQLCRKVMRFPDKPANHDINFKSSIIQSYADNDIKQKQINDVSVDTAYTANHNGGDKAEVKAFGDEMELLPIGIWVKKGKWCHTEDVNKLKKTNGDFIEHNAKEYRHNKVDKTEGKIHDDNIEKLLMDIWASKSKRSKANNIKRQIHTLDIPTEETYESKRNYDSFDTAAEGQYNPAYEIVKLPMGIWIKKFRQSCVDNVRMQSQSSGSNTNQIYNREQRDDDATNRQIINTDSRMDMENKKSDDVIEEKLAIHISQDVIRKVQFAETQSANDTIQLKSVDQTTVHDTAERVQMATQTSKESNKLLVPDKESQGTIYKTSVETTVRCEYDDKADCQQNTSGTDIDKVFEARYCGKVDIGQITDSDMKDGTEEAQSSTDDLKDIVEIKTRRDIFTEKLHDSNVEQQILDEKVQADYRLTFRDMPDKYEQVLETDCAKQGVKENKDGNSVIANKIIHTEDKNIKRSHQNIEDKASHSSEGTRQMQPAKIDARRTRDTKYDRMIAETNKTIDAAKAMVDCAGKGYGSPGIKDIFAAVMASENDNRENEEIFLPVETLFQLTMDSYTDKRCKTKKKSRNKVRFQCETQVNSYGGGKARKDKDRKDKERNKGARQSSHNIPELETGVKPKPSSRNTENEDMSLADMKKLPDEIIYTPKTPKKSTTNQTACADRDQEAEENCRGAEAGFNPGSRKDTAIGAELSSESYVEQNYGNKENPAIKAALSSESYVEQSSDATATENPLRRTRQGPCRKKKRKRRKARWY